MNRRETVSAADAPPAIGPYSHAVAHGSVLYCSGALPIDPASGEIVDDSPAAETQRCLLNLETVCRAAGTTLDRALRLTIYTTDLGEFAAINAAYSEFFPDDPPARAAVGVSALPKGVRVEIDAIVATG
jgi:2-iminobutanoate/2-iminopropanoate deaminase